MQQQPGGTMPPSCDVNNPYHMATSPKLPQQQRQFNSHLPTPLSHHGPYQSTWGQPYYPQATSPYPQYPEYQQNTALSTVGTYGRQMAYPYHNAGNLNRMNSSPGDITGADPTYDGQSSFTNLKTPGSQLIYA